MTEPIRIRCEGSGYATHFPSQVLGGMCSMCGTYVPVNEHGDASNHDRDDILAMIKRGDFG